MEIAVGCAVIEKGAHYLIARRYEDAHLGGLWEFPGGKCLPGEPPALCVVREVREELAIEVGVHGEITSFAHAYPDREILFYFFRCEILGGSPRPIGCAEVRWVAREDLARYPFPPATARFISERL